MPAFQPFEGAYEHDGVRFLWRCYATARIHEVRLADDAPFPEPPEGMKWASPPQNGERRSFASLVDADVEDFSQILVQVSQEPLDGGSSGAGRDGGRAPPPPHQL